MSRISLIFVLRNFKHKKFITTSNPQINMTGKDIM